MVKLAWLMSIVSAVGSWFLCSDIYGKEWVNISPFFWILTVVLFIAMVFIDASSKYLPDRASWYGICAVLLYSLGTLSTFLLIFFVTSMKPVQMFQVASLSAAGLIAFLTVLISAAGQKEYKRLKFAPPAPSKPIGVDSVGLQRTLMIPNLLTASLDRVGVEPAVPEETEKKEEEIIPDSKPNSVPLPPKFGLETLD